MISTRPDPISGIDSSIEGQRRRQAEAREVLAQETEVLHLALASGLVDSAQIASWANAVIRILGSADPVLCALATAGSSPAVVVARLLRSVSGARCSNAAQYEVLWVLSKALEQDPGKARRIAGALERLAGSGLAPDLEHPIRVKAFSRRLETGAGGSTGGGESVTAELRDFLAMRLSVAGRVA